MDNQLKRGLLDVYTLKYGDWNVHMTHPITVLY